jgi:hypothetical protein
MKKIELGDWSDLKDFKLNPDQLIIGVYGSCYQRDNDNRLKTFGIYILDN